jgi:predicted dehydrogenase
VLINRARYRPVMKKLKTAVVGVGYLGKFHAEKFARLPDAELVGVADVNPAAAQRVAQKLGVAAVTDYRELLDRVDAVSIAVPTPQHYTLASDFLNHDVHVLLEKPIAVNLEQAQALVELATRRGRVLQIGHLERFNPAILAMAGSVTQPLFIEVHRLAPFQARGTDISVILDLMIHDLDIVLNLVNSPVQRIDASGAPVLSAAIDIANARIQFENRCVANLTASRVSLKAERKLRLFQQDACITVDFRNKKLGIYRKDPERLQITAEEKLFAEGDALQNEITAFLQAIREGVPPVVSGEDGRRALAAALEISHQLVQNSPLVMG